MEEHLTIGRSLIHDTNHAQIDRRGAVCVRLSRRAAADQQYPLATSRADAVDGDRTLPVGLAAAGGWGDTVLDLPEGRWHDLLTGLDTDGRLADLLAAHPVALLVRKD